MWILPSIFVAYHPFSTHGGEGWHCVRSCGSWLFSMFLWPACPYHSDAHSVWGNANSGTFPLPSSGIFCGKLLHVSFSIRALGHSMWFQDIGPPLSGKMTDGYSASETNHCSMLTPPFFVF
jgi:hypothetical protein